MKALIKTKHGKGNLELRNISEPDCTQDGVKIEIKYCGICGTDIHVMHDTFKNYPPVILGHEFSGVVVETGKNVRNIQKNDRVTVLGSTKVICGECEYCRQGNYVFCAIRRGMGHGVDGGFTKYTVVREDMVYKLPDHVSYEEGALCEPFASAVQGIEELTSFHNGDVVLLSGPGPIGLLCLALILRHGCRVIVAGTDSDRERLELARSWGADIVTDVTKENLDDIVAHETKGRGVDIVVECSGNARAVASGFKSLRKMGSYIQMGILGEKIDFDFDTILYKQLSVYGSIGHSLKTWDRVIRILDHNKIDISKVISHKLPLSKWQEGFELSENKKGIKILLSYDE